MEWYPCGLLNGNPTSPYAILVLNQPLNQNAFDVLVERAALLVCADAGADRLFHYDQNAKPSLKHRLPDAIIGDLDSLSNDVEQHYRAKGVKIIKDCDQYSTDFTKCLKWIYQNSFDTSASANSRLDVVVLGGLGGRVDQGFSQIHHLYLATNDHGLLRGRLYLLSEQSLTFVLDNNINSIYLENDFFQENVGIIPIPGPCHITTEGFEWDVHNWKTEFGGQMSTSNHIRDNKLKVDVKGSRPLFTLELASRFSAMGECPKS